MALSSISYICAALGLFWSSLSTDDRLAWSDRMTDRSRAIKEPMRAFVQRQSSSFQVAPPRRKMEEQKQAVRKNASWA